MNQQPPQVFWVLFHKSDNILAQVLGMSWSHVNSVLGDVRDICFVPNPGFCLLNDNSGINLKQIQVEMVFEIILDP